MEEKKKSYLEEENKNYWKDIEKIEEIFEGKTFMYVNRILNTLSERLKRSTKVVYVKDDKDGYYS